MIDVLREYPVNWPPFSRVANHFGSPHVATKRHLEIYYEVLRSAEILETNKMSVSLHLTQDDHPYDNPSKKLTLYIDDTAGMKVYVPQNYDDQEYTFNMYLAQELFKSMMSHNLTHISERVSQDGVNATRDVLLAPRRRLGAALDDNGIGTIDLEDLDEVPSQQEALDTPTRAGSADGTHGRAPSELEESDMTILGTPAWSEASSTAIRYDGFTVSASARSVHSSISLPIQRTRENLVTLSPSPSQSPAGPEQDLNSIDERSYAQLLEKVITSARVQALPRYGAGGMNPVQVNVSALGTDDERDYYDLNSASQFVRNCKVGAAGELYVSSPYYQGRLPNISGLGSDRGFQVFELLNHLFAHDQLPRFSMENWMSRIRKYVMVHPDYANITPYNEQETSDIVYRDLEGKLTAEFIGKGYLPQDEWATRKPLYFIEVKTTTRSCETAFYMSKAQYKRVSS